MLPKLRRSTVALASMLVLAGCQTAPQREQKRNVAADIAENNANRDPFAAAYNSNDAEAVATYFADDAVMSLPDQPALEGKQDVQTALEDLFKQNAARIKLDLLETQAAGNRAYERDIITESVTPKAGKPIEQSVKHLVFLERQPDGSWKVHRDMDNSNLKGPT